MPSTMIAKSVPSGFAPLSLIQEGDSILAVDGFRIYSPAEFFYLVDRGSTPGRNDLPLIVSRAGEVHEIHVQDLFPSRETYLQLSGEGPWFDQLLDRFGVDYDENLVWSLRKLNRRACFALDDWLKDPVHTQSLEWLAEFVTLYTQLVNQNWDQAKPPVNEIPIPYFEHLTRLYLSIAQRNAVEEKEPDARAHDVSLDAFVFNYPFPRFVPAEFGQVKMTDGEFQRLLETIHRRPDYMMWDIPHSKDPDRRSPERISRIRIRR